MRTTRQIRARLYAGAYDMPRPYVSRRHLTRAGEYLLTAMLGGFILLSGIYSVLSTIGGLDLLR